MKIIEEKPDPSVVKTVVCQDCGVKIEYIPNDVVNLWSRYDYSGEPDGADGFKCLKCNKDIVVKRW